MARARRRRATDAVDAQLRREVRQGRRHRVTPGVSWDRNALGTVLTAPAKVKRSNSLALRPGGTREGPSARLGSSGGAWPPLGNAIRVPSALDGRVHESAAKAR
ncbi:hypothetical protein GCM10012319_52860 [Comamonas sp. KCTC 72670]|nr:hypothetical protein GCM10012319_52860 [Comamonas sp. KCTC 72670]